MVVINDTVCPGCGDRPLGMGLYGKYVVLKKHGTGEPDAELITAGGPEHCRDGWDEKNLWLKKTRCFVLSPEKDDVYGEASRAALVAYANVIEKTNTALHIDLLHWAIQSETDIMCANMDKDE